MSAIKRPRVGMSWEEFTQLDPEEVCQNGHTGPDSGSSGESEATMADDQIHDTPDPTPAPQPVDPRTIRLGGLADMLAEAGVVSADEAFDFVLNLYVELGLKTQEELVKYNRGTNANRQVRDRVRELIDLHGARPASAGEPPADPEPEPVNQPASAEGGITLEEAHAQLREPLIRVRELYVEAQPILDEIDVDERTDEQLAKTRAYHQASKIVYQLIWELGCQVPRRDGLSDEEVQALMSRPARNTHKEWFKAAGDYLIKPVKRDGTALSVDEALSDFRWPCSPKTASARPDPAPQDPAEQRVVRVPSEKQIRNHPRYGELNAEQLKVLDAVLAARVALAAVQQASRDQDPALSEYEEQLRAATPVAHKAFSSALRAFGRMPHPEQDHKWVDRLIWEGDDIVVTILEKERLTPRTDRKPTDTNPPSATDEGAPSDGRHVVHSGAAPPEGYKVTSAGRASGEAGDAESVDDVADGSQDHSPVEQLPTWVVIDFTDEQLIELVGKAEVDRLFDEIYQRFDYSEVSPDMEAIEAEVRGILTQRAREAVTQAN